jgi:hypothetical protein
MPIGPGSARMTSARRPRICRRYGKHKTDSAPVHAVHVVDFDHEELQQQEEEDC